MKNPSLVDKVRNRPYQFVFMALMVAILAEAIVPDLLGAMHAADIMVVLVISVALMTAIQERKQAVIALVLGVPAILLRLTTSAIPDNAVRNRAILMFSALFFAYLIWNVLHDIYSEKRSTGERVFGALCAYVFIGIVFALLYAHLEFRDPDAYAFHLSNESLVEEASSEATLVPMFTYYSFVTLTTLGYGDITPISDAARTLAWMEALIGQLYLAVMVASFVAVHISKKSTEGGGDADAT
jgi:hypothetical protein